MKILQPRRFHPLKSLWVVAVLVAFTLYTSRRDQQPRLWRYTGPTMGSSYTIQVVDARLTESGWRAIKGDVETRLQRINDEMSTWLTNSAISTFNQSPSTFPVSVSPEFADVTRLSLELSRLSGGAFDITFSPMFNLWGFGRSGPKRVPSEDEARTTLAQCGYQHLTVPSPGAVQKDLPGVQIVFNAILPGYTAELLARHLQALGYSNVYVDVGGEIVTRGHNAERQPWRIGIETPTYDAEPGEAVEAIVRLSDGALATSGDYRNYFKDDQGRVFAHIFDPRTGRPATGHVASVTVVATNGGLADALSTTLFVMGPEEGIPWLTNIPGAQTLFILRDSETTFHEVASAGFEALTGYRARSGVMTASETR